MNSRWSPTRSPGARSGGSALAGRVLDDWELTLPLFVKVMPRDYKRALEDLAAVSSGGDGFLTTESEVPG